MTTKFINSVMPCIVHEGKRKPHEGKSDVVLYGHFSGNNIFYVGIGYKSRPYSKYRSDLWKRHVAKYGYRTVVLLKNLKWNEACMIEREFIKTLGKKHDGTGILVNMTDGGEGTRGLKQSEARKEHMRNLFKGKPCSEEQKQQISKTLRGRKLTEEHKINIGLGGKGRIMSETHMKNLKVAGMKRGYSLCKLYKIKLDLESNKLKGSDVMIKHGVSSNIVEKVRKMFILPKRTIIVLPYETKEDIKRMITEGVKNVKIARLLGVSESTVLKIKRLMMYDKVI